MVYNALRIMYVMILNFKINVVFQNKVIYVIG